MSAVVTLKKGEGRTIKAGGAWIFDNEIDTREFDTLKSKKVPQSLEIGLFFCQIFIFII